MKLNARLILITFVIVLITSVTSTLVYYSLSSKLLSKYQNQATLYAVNDLIFAFESYIQLTNEDFNKIKPNLTNFNNVNLDSTGVDFIFTLVGDSLINLNEFKVRQEVILDITSKSFRDFFTNNPNVILYYDKIRKGDIVYYGKVINAKYLDRIAEIIKADLALVIDDMPVELSNSSKNQKNILSIVNAAQNLKYRNNFDLFMDELETADFSAAYYTPTQLLTPGGKISFIVYNTFPEAVDYRNTLKTVMLLIVFAGSALTFVFVFLFTTKLRKQISLLNQAVEITGKGNLEHRVKIITKDEIGKLGEVFNKMLTELKHKELIQKEYSEFITLLNQNPTLNEISEAALSKIIQSTHLTFGVLYIVDDKKLRLISSYGISKHLLISNREADFYSNAVEKREIVEFKFNENFPEIKTGLAVIKIKYLLIYPIIFNKETIAILELASEFIPEDNIKLYIDTIKEQLAIGLINAKSFEQLEIIVNQLSELNSEYQKQNTQITEQNKQLKELHTQLVEKADELEKQRSKAVELTNVKSEFLASMSHELRTPLISILGLTELMLKDNYYLPQAKEKLNIVYRNGKKLLGLITNILEFSRFETSKIEVKKETFLLSELIEEIKPNIEYLSSEKNLHFKIDFNFSGDLLINTDKDKVEHILNNLLVNAVKFTEYGEVILSIQKHETSSLEFCVADTGIGIAPGKQEIIFMEFQQLNNDNSRKRSGVGLGLAICKRYIELLGSKLRLDSVVNKGSSFSFILTDIIVEELTHLPKNQIKSNFKTIERPQHNIVIVGGDINTNRLLKDYLDSYYYNLCEYNESRLAISEMLITKPEAVILCSNQDSIDVWNSIVQIKKNDLLEDLPIIITTVLEDEKVGIIPNIFDYTIKPVNKDLLLKSIKRIEIFNKSEVNELFVVSKDKSSINKLKNELKDHLNITYYDLPEKAFNKIEEREPDIIIIDADDYGSQVLYLCTTLKQRRLTKNIFIILLLPDVIKDDKVKALTKTLHSIALREKNHPLDVLKDIKERLSIDDMATNLRYNLMEMGKEYYDDRKTENSIKVSEATVLVVDDDSDSLFTIGEFVKEAGMKTLFAHNGMECLLTLNHVEPDIILLDIMMPVMDGFETIKKIRNDKRLKHIPVIALTAYAMLDNRKIIEKNGFDDLITKPIDIKSLLIKLHKYLNVETDPK